MRSAASAALLLAAGAQAFKGTAPLLIWGNDESSASVKNVQSALTSSTAPSAEVYSQLRRLGCDWDKVAVVHVKDLHHSRVPALMLPKADFSIPYIIQPDRSELDGYLGEWAEVCGASVGKKAESVEGKVIVHYDMDGTAATLPSADIIILTSTPSASSTPIAPLTPSSSSNKTPNPKIARKAKRSKYLAPLPLLSRQSIDFGALEQGLKEEIAELENQLESAEAEFGFGSESGVGAEGEEGEEVKQEEEQEYKMEDRPEGIDDDSAYADAPSDTDTNTEINADTEEPTGTYDTYQQAPASTSHRYKHRPTSYPGGDDNDNDGEGEGGGKNRTRLPPTDAPLLDRIQLFTTPLLTALLVSFLIFIPVIMLGISSLAGIQVPPRMMEISKGLQVSKEKKEQ